MRPCRTASPPYRLKRKDLSHQERCCLICSPCNNQCNWEKAMGDRSRQLFCKVWRHAFANLTHFLESRAIRGLYDGCHQETTKPCQATEYYPLLLFHVGTHDTARRSLRNIKKDYKALTAAVRNSGVQVVFSSVLPVNGQAFGWASWNWHQQMATGLVAQPGVQLLKSMSLALRNVDWQGPSVGEREEHLWS